MPPQIAVNIRHLPGCKFSRALERIAHGAEASWFLCHPPDPFKEKAVYATFDFGDRICTVKTVNVRMRK